MATCEPCRLINGEERPAPLRRVCSVCKHSYPVCADCDTHGEEHGEEHGDICQRCDASEGLGCRMEGDHA